MPDPKSVFLDEARRLAVPLDTVRPGSGTDDLQPLLAMFGVASVVSLGEATHGTREHFLLKHRILEALAEDGDVQFLLEASLPDALVVDDHVRHGTGTPEAGLAQMRFWTWDTEEVRDLVTWCRHRAVAGQRVPFRGYDAQFAAPAAQRLDRWLRLHGADWAVAAADGLAPVVHELGAGFFPGSAIDDEKDRLGAALDVVRSKADELAGVCPDDAGAATVRLVADAVAQALGMHAADDIWGTRQRRDRSMAENIAAWDAAFDGRSLVWAHNAHVARDGFSGRFPSMGAHLDELTDQVVVGFVFDRGDFQAVHAEERVLQEFTVPSLGPDSLGGALAEVGPDVFALDLRELSDDARAWLAEERELYSIGSGYGGDIVGVPTWDVTTQFDVLVFTAETTRARPNPFGLREVAAPPDPAPAPVNLDLDDGLDGWHEDESRVVNGYRSVVVEDVGEHLLHLYRLQPDVDTGRGARFQHLDATPYRGRRVVLSARGRTTHAATGHGVWLWAHADGPTSVSVHGDALPATGRWEDVGVTIDVPADAETLRVGVALTGPGPADVTQFRLAVG